MMNNLRKRRPAGANPLLPITADHTNRRRRRRRKTNTSSASPVFCCLGSFLVLLGLWYRMQNYNDHTVQSNTTSTAHHNQDSFVATFRCADGSGRGVLNDDYCDCQDGSDEPQTSACSNRVPQQPRFRCKTGDAFVYASRVNDGFRDCPDGSDELNFELKDI